MPGVADAFWLDPAVDVTIAVGIPLPGAPLAASVSVPNLPVFRGIRLGWQSASFGASGAPQASNPVWSLVR